VGAWKQRIIRSYPAPFLLLYGAFKSITLWYLMLKQERFLEHCALLIARIWNELKTE
jgi:hypothetical protein